MIYELMILKSVQEVLGADEIEVQTTPGVVISTAAEYLDLTVAGLMGPGKAYLVAHTRQVAIYLTRSFTELSLPSIGQELEGHDHSAVLHTEYEIAKKIQEKRSSKDQVNDLTVHTRDQTRGTA